MSIKLSYAHTLLIPIGDMHVQKGDIAEATRFIKWLVEGVKSLNHSTNNRALPVFMGDQYHLFGIKGVETEEFWKWAYAYIRAELGYPSLSLTGNHDMNQDESASAMAVHDTDTVVARREGVVIGGDKADTVAIGFIRNEELFYNTVMEWYKVGIRKIFCHAEFNGCQYENGFYAPHGFDVTRYPADLKFYSGHIHLKQEFGNIFYFGSPRHLTRSDMGEKKGVHIFDLTKNTITFQETPAEVWSPFMELNVIEGHADFAAQVQQVEHFAKTLFSPAKLYVNVTGTKEFCRKLSLPDGIKIRSVYTDEVSKVAVRESEGIPATFSKFSKDFFTTNPMPDDIKAAVLERVYQACPTLKNGTV